MTTAAAAPLRCPVCGVSSQPVSARCDCGYDFERQVIVAEEQPSARPERRPRLLETTFILLPSILFFSSGWIGGGSLPAELFGVAFASSVLIGAAVLARSGMVSEQAPAIAVGAYLLVGAVLAFQLVLEFSCRRGDCF